MRLHAHSASCSCVAFFLLSGVSLLLGGTVQGEREAWPSPLPTYSTLAATSAYVLVVSLTCYLLLVIVRENYIIVREDYIIAREDYIITVREDYIVRGDY